MPACDLQEMNVNDHVKPPKTPTEQEPEESPRSKWPKMIQNLFIWPPLLPDENEEDFEELFDSFVKAVGAETVIEFYQAYDVAILTWEIQRYQRTRMKLIGNHTRQAVKNTFAMMLTDQSLVAAEAIVKHDTATQTERFFSDPRFRAQAVHEFDEVDYSIEAATFALALPEIVAIERLIASAQKRLLSFLDNLEKRCAARAKKLGETAAKATGGTAEP